ncbi:MAG: hypothetical protein HOG70_00465, partial [Elusimicrobiaceae bacterium]|nr:hypothetical protein [Elusimicrobiaceae bacterium]
YKTPSLENIIEKKIQSVETKRLIEQAEKIQKIYKTDYESYVKQINECCERYETMRAVPYKIKKFEETTAKYEQDIKNLRNKLEKYSILDEKKVNEFIEKQNIVIVAFESQLETRNASKLRSYEMVVVRSKDLFPTQYIIYPEVFNIKTFDEPEIRIASNKNIPNYSIPVSKKRETNTIITYPNLEKK